MSPRATRPSTQAVNDLSSGSATRCDIPYIPSSKAVACRRPPKETRFGLAPRTAAPFYRHSTPGKSASFVKKCSPTLKEPIAAISRLLLLLASMRSLIGNSPQRFPRHSLLQDPRLTLAFWKEKGKSNSVFTACDMPRCCLLSRSMRHGVLEYTDGWSG